MACMLIAGAPLRRLVLGALQNDRPTTAHVVLTQTGRSVARVRDRGAVQCGARQREARQAAGHSLAWPNLLRAAVQISVGEFREPSRSRYEAPRRGSLARIERPDRYIHIHHVEMHIHETTALSDSAPPSQKRDERTPTHPSISPRARLARRDPRPGIYSRAPSHLAWLATAHLVLDGLRCAALSSALPCKPVHLPPPKHVGTAPRRAPALESSRRGRGRPQTRSMLRRRGARECIPDAGGGRRRSGLSLPAQRQVRTRYLVCRTEGRRGGEGASAMCVPGCTSHGKY